MADIPACTKIVIVDDCSTDTKVHELIDNFNYPDCEKIFFQSSENKSLNNSLLVGFGYCFEAGCKYVINLDSDAIVNNLFITKLISLKKLFPENRLIRHLKKCALLFGCPNAKNFFLSRYEAPLPTSPACNAQCAGCISYQPEARCPVTQPRIKFVPTPEEIAEIALFHINMVKKPVVSFGQGCEGEPLLCADIIEKAIKLIRAKTLRGVINMNTNASKAGAISKLFDAGLDSIRVSLNSVREIYYKRYYRPKGYSFKEVLRSINTAKGKGGFVAINYLTMPGFTDSKDEFTAFKKFIEKNSFILSIMSFGFFFALIAAATSSLALFPVNIRK